MNNSIKFTEKGFIKISAKDKDGAIEILVSDTGKGIKKEDTVKLFKAFTQIERKTGGAGLGLAISKGIVEAHGGKMWAESVSGKGTTIGFTLPIK
jgi:signal transduction histidine kinase